MIKSLNKYDYFAYLFAVSIVLIYFFLHPLCADVTWLLYVAKSMLHGAEIYTDVMEVNPPLIILLTAISSFFADLLSISDKFSFIIFVIFLITISLYLSYYILEKVQFIKRSSLKILFLSLLFIFMIAPSWDFGQREHLFVIFIFPYFLTQMFYKEIEIPKNTLIVISLFAAIGFNLKPYFFVVFVFIELVNYYYSRNIAEFFRLSNRIIISVALLYVLVIFLFFHAYIDTLLPVAVAAYEVFATRTFTQIIFYNLYDIIVGLVVFVYALILFIRIRSRDLLMLLSVMIATLFLYFYQYKGWHYHILPFFLVTLFTLVYLLLFYTKKEYRVYGMTILPLIIMIIVKNAYSQDFSSLEERLKTFEASSKIVVFSGDIAMGEPLLQYEQQWSSRFPSLWMINALLKNDATFLKKYMFGAIYEDLLQYKPDYILFYRPQRGFDYYGYIVKNSSKIKRYLLKNYTYESDEKFVILRKND